MATRTAHNTCNQQQERAAQSFKRLESAAWLAAWGILWLLWLVALLTFSRWDAAFSTSGDGAPLRNWLGWYGARLADVSYYFLGLSVWVLALLMLRLWLGGLARLLRLRSPLPNQAPARNRVGWRFWLGVVILLAACSALEWSRLYSAEKYLPGSSGGVLGFLLGTTAERHLGFNLSALLWVALLVWGVAWSLRFSWLNFAETIGARVSNKVEGFLYQREVARDMAEGAKAAHVRETTVEVARAEQREKPALQTITRLEPLPAEKAKAAAAPSPRVQEEKQDTLFSNEMQARLPPVHLLDAAPANQETVAPELLEMTSRLIEKKLKDFGVAVTVVAASPGPVITRYEIEPAVGVKGSQIVGLARDLARSLSLISIRVVETIPGKNFMALELPNAKRQTIRLSEIIGANIYYQSKSLLTIALGKDIVGNPVVADLAKMPHVLVAGTTGSGKSVGINAMILSLLYKAEAHDVRLMLIDPKMLEMSVYEGIPHLLCPVVTDMRQAANGLTWCVAEMERRYKLMSKLGVRNLAGYNHKIDEAKAAEQLIGNPFSLTPEEPEPLDRLPHIVIVIDELADLMMVVGKKVEELIARLAQKARAAGIHLILATQRPSVDVITGLIKANVPSRIAFQVSSKIDSRTILDQMGAESLLGMGDMLYMPVGSGFPTRVHGAFVSDEEVHRVVAELKELGDANYIEGILEGGTVDEEGGVDGMGEGGGEKDPMYDQAVAVMMKIGKATTSSVQRHLKIGYNRAARILDEMEAAGLVSKPGHNNQREILVPRSNSQDD